MDADNYNDGLRGGRIRVRARISQEDKQTLVINQIPFSTTTSSLIDSILKANDKGKIKIKKIEDNTRGVQVGDVLLEVKSYKVYVAAKKARQCKMYLRF